jgi:hypothetical protein
MVTLQGRPRELLAGSTSLWKSPHVNPWDAMFGIFPRWCITHHDSMHCFSIFFDFFSGFPRPPFEIQVRIAVPSMSARWGGNHGLVLVLGSHTPRGPPYIFPIFSWCAFLIAPVQNWFKMDLGQKIIHYMAEGRDNS